MEAGKLVLVSIFDVSAVIDTVDHNILINVLDTEFGVLQWMRVPYITSARETTNQN